MADQTLLIIEADRDTAEVLRTYFSARGYQVWVAITGEKGIQLARAEKPALILIDESLPDIDPYELAEELRADPDTTHIPFIFLTQTDQRRDKIASLGSGVDDFIIKPPDLEAMRRRVQQVIERAEQLNMVRRYLPPEAAEPEPADDLVTREEAPPPPPAAPAPAQPAPAPSVQAPGTRPLAEAPDETARRSPSRPLTPEDKAIRFGAYYPREVVPNEWKPLIAYVYYAFAENAVNADAGKQLGPLATGFRKLTQAARGLIKEGASVTATLFLPGFQVNPPSATIAFYEDWHRFDFKIRAKDAPLHQAVNGRITFTVEGVIVGDVPVSIYVAETEQNVPTLQTVARIYDSVFCSYSRKDVHIVERVERAYKALGMAYLRDMTTLRSGEQWSDELKKLITHANIFQLFWSPASAQSDHVRMEWEYALSLERDSAGFIRPVYWTQPMPPPPPALSHLHFAYQPDLVD